MVVKQSSRTPKMKNFTVEGVDFDCQATEFLSQAFIVTEYKAITNEMIEMSHTGKYVALCNLLDNCAFRCIPLLLL